MRTFNISLGVIGFVALLSVSASSQTLTSGPLPETTNGQVVELSKKALSGDTRAQLLLGIAFEFGQGVDKNLDEAMHWYHLAADRGDPVAQTNLAYLYESGASGPTDPEEAAKGYLRAAVSGFARAQFNLGTLYLRGAGVQRSAQTAAHLFSEPADTGCPAAIAARGSLLSNLKSVPPD